MPGIRIASQEIFPTGKILAPLSLHTVVRLPRDLRALQADAPPHLLACLSCTLGGDRSWEPRRRGLLWWQLQKIPQKPLSVFTVAGSGALRQRVEVFL